MATLDDTLNELGVEHRPDGSAVLSVHLGTAPLSILPSALQAAQALIEETLQAAADGRAIVWLVARVPIDTPPEERAELVRRAGAVLAGLNDPAMANTPVKPAEPLT